MKKFGKNRNKVSTEEDSNVVFGEKRWEEAVSQTNLKEGKGYKYRNPAYETDVFQSGILTSEDKIRLMRANGQMKPCPFCKEINPKHFSSTCESRVRSSRPCKYCGKIHAHKESECQSKPPKLKAINAPKAFHELGATERRMLKREEKRLGTPATPSVVDVLGNMVQAIDNPKYEKRNSKGIKEPTFADILQVTQAFRDTVIRMAYEQGEKFFKLNSKESKLAARLPRATALVEKPLVAVVALKTKDKTLTNKARKHRNVAKPKIIVVDSSLKKEPTVTTPLIIQNASHNKERFK